MAVVVRTPTDAKSRRRLTTQLGTRDAMVLRLIRVVTRECLLAATPA